MLNKSTWLHLRIPFSFYLLPVFLFVLSISPGAGISEILLVFIILHLFLYPASNGYNSYFDKDVASIGGLENPPPVRKELYFTSLGFDFIALLLGFFISLEFVWMLLIYGLISKAYSHPAIRLKKYPYGGWFMAGLFQGFFTFLMVYIGINQIALAEILQPQIIIPAFLSSVLLWGSFPMTQIYQHQEDYRRGDITLSLKLGIEGTFIFTASTFILASAGFFWFYNAFYSIFDSLLFLLFILPMLLYFVNWFMRVKKDHDQANFRSCMQLNAISAVCLNLFFLIFYLSH